MDGRMAGWWDRWVTGWLDGKMAGRSWMTFRRFSGDFPSSSYDHFQVIDRLFTMMATMTTMTTMTTTITTTTTTIFSSLTALTTSIYSLNDVSFPSQSSFSLNGAETSHVHESLCTAVKAHFFSCGRDRSLECPFSVGKS